MTVALIWKLRFHKNHILLTLNFLQYRTNDLIIEHEKIMTLNSTFNDESKEPAIKTTARSTNNAAGKLNPNPPSTVIPQPATISRDMAVPFTSSNTKPKKNLQNTIRPIKRRSSFLESSALQTNNELAVDEDCEVERKKSKLLDTTTVELRKTSLGMQLV